MRRKEFLVRWQVHGITHDQTRTRETMHREASEEADDVLASAAIAVSGESAIVRLLPFA